MGNQELATSAAACPPTDSILRIELTCHYAGKDQRILDLLQAERAEDKTHAFILFRFFPYMDGLQSIFVIIN